VTAICKHAVSTIQNTKYGEVQIIVLTYDYHKPNKSGLRPCATMNCQRNARSPCDEAEEEDECSCMCRGSRYYNCTANFPLTGSRTLKQAKVWHIILFFITVSKVAIVSALLLTPNTAGSSKLFAICNHNLCQ
jgi:hypothetical protein